MELKFKYKFFDFVAKATWYNAFEKFVRYSGGIFK